MLTYQEKKFIDLLDSFNRDQLGEVRKQEEKTNKWRNIFMHAFPRNLISSIQINDYLISRRSVNDSSFCRKICSELKSNFFIDIGNKNWADTFGIAVKHGTQIELSKNLAGKFGSDYNGAFIYIINEIVTLLDGIDNDNYAAVEYCDLSHKFKYMLLVIYCSEKILPVCSEMLLERFCEKTCLSHSSSHEMVYMSQSLIEWKNDVPEIAEWNNYIFTGFCAWLYRKNYIIEGNLLRTNARISTETSKEEIDIRGESKEALVKVRINQRIFRHKLLSYYNKCCLCGVDNPNLLVASHIKPWSVCEPEERLDIANGFLMCPNHDRLFDQGWITFNDEGKIIIADRLSEYDRISLNVRDDINISLTEKNKNYLKYHRGRVFKNS